MVQYSWLIFCCMHEHSLIPLFSFQTKSYYCSKESSGKTQQENRQIDPTLSSPGVESNTKRNGEKVSITFY